jgi:hypothetical protein
MALFSYAPLHLSEIGFIPLNLVAVIYCIKWILAIRIDQIEDVGSTIMLQQMDGSHLNHIKRERHKNEIDVRTHRSVRHQDHL